MLRTDVVVSELQRFAQTQLEDFLGARCEGDVTGRSLLALADDLLDLAADSLEEIPNDSNDLAATPSPS
ncbi:hypothetical protein GCM10020255_049090 [Rhodococcus baikonurensis]